MYATEPFGVELDAAVYAFDVSTIDLCLSVFAWAPFRSTKAAIKLHTLLDLRGNIPSFIHITDGKTHEVNVMNDLVLEPSAFYLMDRGYLDFARLFVIHEAKAFFVTRAKSNTKFNRRYSLPVDRINTAVLCDQTGATGSSCVQGRSHDDAPGGGQGRHRQAPGVSDQQLHAQTGVDRRLVPPNSLFV